LEADVALANALRELVEVERAKMVPKLLEGANGTKARTTLYPDKVPKPGKDPSLAGSCHFAGRTFTLRAWIGPGQSFINLELAIL
jgi:hypothetical protein